LRIVTGFGAVRALVVSNIAVSIVRLIASAVPELTRGTGIKINERV
jgi:hypothetical protein